MRGKRVWLRAGVKAVSGTLCLGLLLSAAQAGADEAGAAGEDVVPATQTGTGPEFTTELDPYYSNAGVYFNLTDKPIPEITEDEEASLYQQLLQLPLIPQQAVLEVSINPLPILGVLIQENSTDFYDDNRGLIQAVTEGFPEPFAVSAFFGSVVRYTRADQPSDENNRGLSGFLLSAGTRHIRKNVMVDDDWYEFEWKLKGDRDFGDTSLAWSGRVGTKVHSNDDIADTYYLAIRREHFDVSVEGFSWIDNSDVEYKIEFDRDSGEVVQHEIFYDTKWPISLGMGTGTAVSFGVGLVAERGKYSGELGEDDDRDTRLILRPELEF